MQVSVETISSLERKMTIVVPAERIGNEVKERLEKAAKTVRIDGFRAGRVPLNVVNQHYGQGIRQEVVSETVRTCFYDAVTQENLTPASAPAIEPKIDKPGIDLEFIATFEVLPDFDLADLTTIKIAKPLAEVKDSDVDVMIKGLRKQHATWSEVNRAAVADDEATIDYVGLKNGKEFDGGSAENYPLEIGGGTAVAGFEEGVIGMSVGDEKTIPVTFPENYQAEELRGASVEFKIKLNALKEPLLPEMNDEFFTLFGLKAGGEPVFRSAVLQNMQRDLKNALEGKVKSRVMHELFTLHSDIEVPLTRIATEITSLKQQMAKNLGGDGGENTFDPSLLPDEMFEEQAKRRAIVGLVVNEIVQSNKMDVDGVAVKRRIQDIAASYDQPEEVMKYHYNSPELLKSIEANVLQDQVVDFVLSQAKVSDEPQDYQKAIAPDPDQVATKN
ncbi:MAG: trigger factor [Porticoccus sp.]|jgi:trigger factor|nr:trigger factor [Porticoccus sp.]